MSHGYSLTFAGFAASIIVGAPIVVAACGAVVCGAGQPRRLTAWQTRGVRDDFPKLVTELTRLRPRAGRVMLGICGPPGSGKTTFADRLRVQIERDSGLRAACVPMDGF